MTDLLVRCGMGDFKKWGGILVMGGERVDTPLQTMISIGSIPYAVTIIVCLRPCKPQILSQLCIELLKDPD